MNKKYNTLEEAKFGMDKFAEDMKHFKKEVEFLKSQLEQKQDMYDFVSHQFHMAENAVVDFEMDEYINSLGEDEKD